MKQLGKHGVVTTEDLLNETSTLVKLKSLSAESGIRPKLLKKWSSIADLIQVEGINQKIAKLLIKIGIKNRDELSQQDPDKVMEKLEANKKFQKKLKNIISKTDIENWIKNALNI